MKIFPSSSIKKLDAYTIEHEPIASIDLMERAAQALTKAITNRWNPETPVTIFAGPGNNGGDALAIARMMAEKGYKIEVYLFNTKGELSPDCQTNKELVEMMEEVTFHEISTQFVPPTLTPEHLVIDGLFGSGLNKPLSGGFAAVVKYINASPAMVVSIDIPSGLMGEENTFNVKSNIIRADVTFSLQLPKLVADALLGEEQATHRRSPDDTPHQHCYLHGNQHNALDLLSPADEPLRSSIVWS